MAYGAAGSVLAVAQGPDVILFDVKGIRQIARGSAGSGTGSVTALSFDGDGRHLLAGTDRGAVLMWDITAMARQPVVLQTSGAPVVTVALSPNSSFAAWAGRTDGLTLRRIDGIDQAHRISETGGITSLVFTTPTVVVAGRMFRSRAPIPALQAYDVTGLTQPKSLLPAGTSVFGTRGIASLAFASKHNLLLSGGVDGNLRLWQADSLQQIRAIKLHTSIDGLATSADGGTVLLGMDHFVPLDALDRTSGNAQVQALDVASGKELGAPYLSGSTALTSVLAMKPDGDGFATTTDAGRTLLWRAPLRPDPAGPVNELIPDPGDSRAVLALHENGDLIRVATTSDKRTLLGHVATQDKSFALAADPAGRLLAVGQSNGSVALWSYPTLRLLGAIPGSGPPDDVIRLAFSPDGRTLVMGTARGIVRIVRLGLTAAAGTPPVQLTDSDHATVGSIAWSHDGFRLLIGRRDGDTKLWSTSGVMQLDTHFPTDAAVVISAQDGYLIGFGEGTIGRFDDTLSLRRWLPLRHGNNILAAQLSSDTRTLVTTGADHTGMVIDVPSVTELLRVASPEPEAGTGEAFYEGSFFSAALTIDTRSAVFGTTGGALQTVLLSQDPLISYACSLLSGQDRDRCR